MHEYYRHLGRHLQQLSLSALPQIVDGLETIEEYSELILPIENTTSTEESSGRILNQADVEKLFGDLDLDIHEPEPFDLLPTWEEAIGRAMRLLEQSQGDEDESDKETIESRVARIKARVAELTGNTSQCEHPGAAERERSQGPRC